MGQIDMPSLNRTSLTQSEKAQAPDNQPMKRLKEIYKNFKFVKVPSKEY